MIPKAKAVFDADTSAMSAKLDRVKKQAGGIGGEFQKSIPIMNQMTSIAGVIGTAITGITMAVQKYNEELDKGKRLLKEQQSIGSVAGIGGTLGQIPQFRQAIDAGLGFGNLGREELTQMAGTFKGRFTGAGAGDIRTASVMIQGASRGQFNTEQMIEIVTGAGTLGAAGFSTKDAMDISAMIVRKSGRFAGEVIDAISEVSALAGKEEAMSLLPYFLAIGDQAVISTYTSEAAQLAERGMTSGIANAVPFTDEVRRRTAAAGPLNYTNFIDRQAALAETDRATYLQNQVGRELSAAQRTGPGSEAMMINAIEDQLQEAYKERRLNQAGGFFERLWLQLRFAAGEENMAISPQGMTLTDLGSLNTRNNVGGFNRTADIGVEAARLRVIIDEDNSKPVALKPNGQE